MKNYVRKLNKRKLNNPLKNRLWKTELNKKAWLSFIKTEIWVNRVWVEGVWTDSFWVDEEEIYSKSCNFKKEYDDSLGNMESIRNLGYLLEKYDGVKLDCFLKSHLEK